MTRKIVLLLVLLNLSPIFAISETQRDLQEFQALQSNEQKSIDSHENEQSFLRTMITPYLNMGPARLYLMFRRGINPCIVDTALSFAGIKNAYAKMGTHAAFNTATHIAAYKAIDPQLPLKQLAKGALIFSGAEAVKGTLNEVAKKHLMRSFTSEMALKMIPERLWVVAQSLYNKAEFDRRMGNDLLNADSKLDARLRPTIYSDQMHHLIAERTVDLRIIMDSLQTQSELHPNDSNISDALYAARKYMQGTQGILRNLKDVAVCYLKEQVEATIDKNVDWAIEYVQQKR